MEPSRPRSKKSFLVEERCTLRRHLWSANTVAKGETKAECRFSHAEKGELRNFGKYDRDMCTVESAEDIPVHLRMLKPDTDLN